MSEKIRVAAYIRVSVSSSQMEHSLKAQEDYYRELISNNREWAFAGIFADFGVSGTSIKNRSEFNRMIADCKAGKIDKILVKSVSRFARNTLELLQTIRKLKEIGVSVWFEEQNLDSMTKEGEVMLTLMASIAQAESESLSESIKWTIRKGFENGIGNTKRRCFGYEWIDGRLTIIPKEAEVVRRIFANFLNGGSHMKMAEELTNEGITSVNGNPISVSAISFMLRNVTYTGNTLLQKTFIKDPISKKKVRNTGQLPQYFVLDSHEAIIDMETFEKAQELLAKKKERGNFPYNRTGKNYPFTKKIICGCCGRHYTRQLWNKKKCPTWVCTGKKLQKSNRCYAKNISERKLMERSARILGLEHFDEDIFNHQVESITVQGREELIFSLKDGKISIDKM